MPKPGIRKPSFARHETTSRGHAIKEATHMPPGLAAAAQLQSVVDGLGSQLTGLCRISDTHTRRDGGCLNMWIQFDLSRANEYNK